MASINGMDDHSKFFPINVETNTANNTNGINRDNSINNPTANNNPDFQTIFRALLEGMMNNGFNLDGAGASQNNGLNSLPGLPGDGDSTSKLLTLLAQLQQSDQPAQDTEQTDDHFLAQILSGFDKIASKNPAPDTSYSQAITKYMQVMGNSRKAFDSLATGADMNAVTGILNGKSGAVPNISGVLTPGVNPDKQEIIEYITEEAKKIGLPEQLALATAVTESEMTQFNKDGTPHRNSNPGSTDWGVMQINDKAWGDTYDMNLIKSDWKYNVRAGLQILKDSYDAAVKHNEGGKGANNTDQNLARAAYSGYNAGVGNIWRYRTPVDSAPKTGLYDVLNNEGYDLRDIRFWDNYQKMS